MGRFSAIFCDICQQVIEEATYSIRFEYRKKNRPISTREYLEVCNDCGWVLVNRIQGVLESVITERRGGPRPASPPKT